MKTLVIGDVQITAHSNFDVIQATAQFIIKKRPQEIVIIGDWFDLESLSFYASEKEREGRRLKADIRAGILGLDYLLQPLRKLQVKQKCAKKKVYQPKIVFTMGNHEERLITFLNKQPNLIGSLPDIESILKSRGIDVYPFLKPYVGLNDVHFFHYLANPMTGKAVGGSMDNKLNKVTYSFVHGHQQHFQFAERQQASGYPQFGVCVGAFYEHDESYKGYQGNTHSRGTVLLHHHGKGVDVEYISCERMKLLGAGERLASKKLKVKFI